MRATGAVGHVGVALQRIGEAGVLRDGSVGQVQFLRVGFFEWLARQWRDVLDDRSRHRQSGGNNRLGFLVQVDELGVAAALEVGHAVLGPGVLVIADEFTIRIG